MSIFSKTGLIADITNNIYTNVQRLIKGNTLKARLLNIVDSTFVRVVDTAANFTANNPILGDGEIGVESDSLLTSPKFKIGDGSTSWNSLPYANSGTSNVNYIADTAANLAANNPVMPDGYFGIESDTLLTSPKFKIAASSTPWNSLPYAVSQTLQQVVNNDNTVNGTIAKSLSNLTTIGVTDQWGEIRYFDGIVKGLVQPSYIQTLLSWENAVASGFVKINEFKTKVTHTALNEFDAPLHTFNNSVTKNGLEVATENYVNNLIAGLKFKLDVVAASIANVNISSAPSTLDGVTLTSGDRVLLKNQTTQSENGCYDFNGTGNALTRSDDSDSGVKLVSATYPVSGGATNQDTWFTVTNDSITLGSTNIVITQTAGSGTYTVGSYLKLIGNVFDIDFTTFSTTQITEGTKLFFTDARVLTAPLTGFASAAGTITAADTILSAINKLNGNVALKAATTYVDDLKANFINKKNSDTPHTGTTSPTVIHSFEITPGTCQANDVLKFYIRHLSTNNANTKTVKMWANTSNTISGATQLSNYAYTTNSGGVLPFKRSLIFKNSLSSQKIINTTVTHANDEDSYPNNGDATLTLDFNNSVFIFIEITLANAGDTFTMNLFNCKIER